MGDMHEIVFSRLPRWHLWLKFNVDAHSLAVKWLTSTIIATEVTQTNLKCGFTDKSLIHSGTRVPLSCGFQHDNSLIKLLLRANNHVIFMEILGAYFFVVITRSVLAMFAHTHAYKHLHVQHTLCISRCIEAVWTREYHEATNSHSAVRVWADCHQPTKTLST